MAESSRNELRWELLIADCWDDEKLKERLLKDPAGVCKERGIEIPAGAKLNVLESSEAVIHVVIPPKPAAEELSEETLESVAGGCDTFGGSGGGSCFGGSSCFGGGGSCFGGGGSCFGGGGGGCFGGGGGCGGGGGGCFGGGGCGGCRACGGCRGCRP